jgi:hypothetical protein
MSRTLWQFTRAVAAAGDLSPDMETFLAHSGQFRFPPPPEDPAQRARDARAEAASRMRAWFAANLPQMEIAPDQRPDSHIEPYIGLPSLAKRSIEPMRFYARTHRLERRTGHLLGEAIINCGAVSPPQLRRAFAKAGKLQLKQMRNPDLRPAGFILDSTVGDDGVVNLRFVVGDEAACAKLASKVYSGVILALDDGEIADISLVDAPVDFLGVEKRSQVLVKVFTNESEVMSKLKKAAKKMSRRTGYPVAACAAALAEVDALRKGPRLPASAAAALGNLDAAVAALPNAQDQLAAKAAVGRAQTQIGVELVKAARTRPVGYGDLGMIDFLRHGRR